MVWVWVWVWGLLVLSVGVGDPVDELLRGVLGIEGGFGVAVAALVGGGDKPLVAVRNGQNVDERAVVEIGAEDKPLVHGFLGAWVLGFMVGGIKVG